MKPTALEIIRVLMWLDGQSTAPKTIAALKTWLWKELERFAVEKNE